MNRYINHVITASAGTGKTYRLSLEYINLILQFKPEYCNSSSQDCLIGDIPTFFEEILVITFTKKATAEIREKIFEHLAELTADRPDQKLMNNFENYYNHTFTPSDFEFLKRIRNEMLINKHKVRISTIDSFVNSIFKSVIAPYLGVTEYSIDNAANTRYLPTFYEAIMNNSIVLDKMTDLFSVSGRKRIDDFDNLILSIIDNRWLFHLINEAPAKFQPSPDELALIKKGYLETNCELFTLFKENMKRNGKENDLARNLIKTDFHPFIARSDESINEFLDSLQVKVADDNFLKENWRLLTSSSNFWNGVKCLKGKNNELDKETLITLSELSKNRLSTYLYFKLFLHEEKTITVLAEFLLNIYDQIKERERVFTYNDVTYYTFTNLYGPELSLIDTDETVLNRFYEFLSTSIRFMLIDEYQDTSITQHKILLPIMLELISGKGVKDYGGVVVVGDEKQSIYGWRAGERDLLLRIGKIMRTEDYSSLKFSHRSTKPIVDFINSVFGELSLRISALPDEMKFSWGYDSIEPFSDSLQGYIRIVFDNYGLKEASNLSSGKEDIYKRFVETTLLPLYREGGIDLSKTAILARYNADLQGIARELDEYGIEYYQESSLAITYHPVIKPIMYLLKYIVYRRPLKLLEFLRSDFCLLDADAMKKVIFVLNDSHTSKELILPTLQKEFASNSAISKTTQIVEKAESLNLVGLLNLIIEEFNVVTLSPQEHNLKNLHYFLELATLFSNQKETELTVDFKGFLSYLEANETNDILKQQSVENKGSLQLMTIHKSKGLGFETVITFLDTSRTARSDARELSIKTKYESNLAHLSDYDVGYNYTPLLKTAKPGLFTINQNKITIEEINNLYVALTRAEKNIMLYLAYKKRDSLERLIEDYESKIQSEGIKIGKEFLAILHRYLSQNSTLFTNDDTGSIFEAGMMRMQQSTSSDLPEPLEVPYQDFLSYNKHLGLTERAGLKSRVNLKTVYLQNLQPLLGELVHYYLSLIIYASEDELRRARARTINRYGANIDESILTSVLKKVDSFIKNNSYLFAGGWTKVFTEKIVYSSTEQEYRIDRLMIDEQKKRILIVDYKTGSIAEKDQIANYQEAIAELRLIDHKDYNVQTKYLAIDLDFSKQ